jgi:predicted ATPase
VQDRQTSLDPFVGRAAELARVAEVMARVETGQPWVVAIEGDPGVGKTSLARRCLAEVTGLRVLAARADQAETDLDFGIVDQLLRAAGDASRRSCPRTGPARLPRRSRWAPGCWKWWESSRPTGR